MSEPETLIAKISAAIVAELKRQEVRTGCTTDADDRYAQVDGSFLIAPLARAVLQGIREPTVNMAMAGGRHRVEGGSGDMWRAMIDAALVEYGTMNEEAKAAYRARLSAMDDRCVINEFVAAEDDEDAERAQLAADECERRNLDI